MRFSLAPLLAGALLTTLSARAESQSDVLRSRAAGPYLGFGIESASIVVFDGADIEESGGGAGLLLGYGFSPHWSLYTQVNASSMKVAGGDSEYSLVHFDLGTRIHFRAGPHRVVPFMHVALTGRTTVYDDADGTRNTSTGGGLSLGTGLNVHVKPSLAISGALTWTLGTFDEYEAGGRPIDGTEIVAGTTRVQLGLTWFPRR